MDKYAITKQVLLQAGPGSASPEAAEPSLGAIMTAISDLKTTLEPKLDVVMTEVSFLRADLQKITDKVSTAKTNILMLQSTSKRLEEQVQNLTKQHKLMTAKLADEKGRAIRNNIRVVGIPEGADEPSVDSILEDLIINTLCPKRLLKFFSGERAHLVPILPLKPGAPPRTITDRIFNHHNRDAVLLVARTHGNLHYENTIIRFFPDFTLQFAQDEYSNSRERGLGREGQKGGRTRGQYTARQRQDWSPYDDY
ncbi:hypothetical protein NDU88_006327 [Pleurodeles waltl]|uniref:Uncharacterized protein n=1 Tax=Pleurodeles waltl TaxID=8319 RepID=A0AAV7VPD7_PLEWA|nr:hypothetical protein NDU88_006327 [Pleurodeles waltl]